MTRTNPTNPAEPANLDRSAVPTSDQTTGLRLTRRRLIAAGGAAALAGLAGLGRPGAVAAAEWPYAVPVLASQRTDTIVVAMEAEPPNLDPGQYVGLHAARVIYRMTDGLLRTKPDSTQVEPALATSWEITEGGSVYTFKLREGVKFHDGTPFNAEAAKFSLERPLFKDHPYYSTGNWSFVTTYLSMVDRVEAPSEYTLRITLKYPYAPFLSRMAQVASHFMSPTAIQKYGPDIVANPVGTGRYRFESWERGNRIVLRRNDDYWGEPAVNQTLVFRWVIENQARVTELLTGGADIILPVAPDFLPQLEMDPNVNTLRGPGIHFWYMSFNLRQPPFDDRRVRQAMAYAIDKQVIVHDILRDTAIIANGPLNPDTWGKYAGENGYSYDPDRARTLLRDAGVADGFSFPFWVCESGSGMQSPMDMCTVIQSQWARVGLNAQIQTFEWTAYLAKLRAGEGQVYPLSWLAGFEDPDFVLYPLYYSKNVPLPNFAGYNNPDVDAGLDAARRETDQSRRAEIYARVQELISQDVPYIPIDHDVQIVATARNVKGFTLHPGYELRVENAYKD